MRKKEIDELKAENEQMKNELEKCVTYFSQMQLKNYRERETT